MTANRANALGQTKASLRSVFPQGICGVKGPEGVLSKLWYLLSFLILALFGCATGPKLADSQSLIPAQLPTSSRVFVYRLPALQGAAIQPAVMLDGTPVGKARPGGVFFVDVEPGQHIVSVKGDDELILPLVARAGGIQYVRLMIEPATWTTNIRPVLVEEEIASHEMKSLALIRE